jgi:hypothetical protein
VRSQDPDERPAVEAIGDFEHGVDLAENDGVGNVPRIDGREGGVDLAGILFVHGHGDVQPAPAAAETVHHLEAPQVRAHQQGAAAALQLRGHQFLAFERDVEPGKLTIDQENAIVNGGGKGQDLPKTVARIRPAAEREPQIAARLTAC